MRRLIPWGAATMLALGSWACGDDGDSAPPDGVVLPGDDERVDEPAPYIFDEATDEVEPSLTPEALGTAIEQAITTVMTIDVAPIKDAYDALLDGVDGTGCPLVARNYDGGVGGAQAGENLYWQGECERPDGRTFSGFGALATFEGANFGGGIVLDGWFVNHSGRIAIPGDLALEGSGSASQGEGDNEFADIFTQGFNGTFVLSGGRTVSTWFDGSRNPSLEIFAVIGKQAPGKAVTINGGIAGLEGDVSTVAFNNMENFQASLGSPCEEEPRGSLSVRDADGEWYDILFHGASFEERDIDPTKCDGCGETWFRGEQVGETCVDFSKLYEWENRPW